MIVIKPLKIRKINDELKIIHENAMRYADTSITYFEKYQETNNPNKLDIAIIYKNLFREKTNDWMALRNERDLLEAKPFIFWE